MNKKDLQEIQLRLYSCSIIVSFQELYDMHLASKLQDSEIVATLNSINYMRVNHPNACCYYLTSKHLKGSNGIRYGDNGDYISFKPFKRIKR